MAAVSISERLSQLRGMLHERPSARRWEEICGLFDGWPEAEDLAVGLDYARRGTQRWPDAMLTLPARWQARLDQGQAEPRAVLARVRRVWSPPGGARSRVQIEEEGGEGFVEEAPFEEVEPRTMRGAALSPDQRRVAIWTAALGAQEGPRLEEFALDGGAPMVWMEGLEEGELQEVRYSPDGARVAGLFFGMGLRPEVRVWEVGEQGARWGLPTQPEGQRSWADRCALAWSPDGRWLAVSSSRSGRVVVAEARGGAVVAQWAAPAASALAWSVSGDALLVGDRRGQVARYEAAQGWAQGARLQGGASALAVGEDASGRWWLVVGEDNQARLWARRGGQFTREATFGFALGNLSRRYEVCATGAEGLRLLNPWSEAGMEVHELPQRAARELTERPAFCAMAPGGDALVFEKAGELWAWWLD